ncbi:DUF342 domain-containing protein, partial [Oribacterium sp. WCC10]|uniref:DUF342 domain-containing protein n=1 Tax=Oribacterium sp. WCC10 TaxID=1855343 RepID=UPI0008E18121
MKRRNLCKTKKAIAVIISASMVMGTGMQAIAATDYASESGVEVVVSDGGSESEKVENATASVDDKGDARGVLAYADENSSATVEVEKDASATASKNNSESSYYGGSYAYGISADSTDESSIKVSVGNDVTATAGNAGGDSYDDNEAFGVYIGSHGDSSTEVSVGNNITASATGTADDESSKWNQAGGIYVDLTQDSAAKVSVGNDVSVTASGTDDTHYGMSRSTGTNVRASVDSKAEVDIGNNLTVSGIDEATGIYVDNYKNSSGTVSVGGNVSVTSSSKGEAMGVDVTTHRNSTGEVDIGNDLTVSGGTSYGIRAHSTDDKSSLTVNVGGDVTVSGDEFSNSINGATTGTLDINVGGNVIQEGESGVAVQLNDFEEETGKITVKVAENVTAAGGAVSVAKSTDKSMIDLVVGGTISGGEHNIVLEETYVYSEEDEDWLPTASSTENLSITVWKIDPVKDSGNLVENSKFVSSEDSSASSYEYTRNEEAEQNINYIIKVDPVTATGGAIGLSGTTELHGYQTAHQGDKVYLEITVPARYTVDSFYNVDGAANVQVISSDGKYYLEVPRGGGVFVGVNLKKISSTEIDASNVVATEGDHRKSDSGSGQNWSVGNNTGNAGNDAPGFSSDMTRYQGLTIQAPNLAGTNTVLNITDVLMPLDPMAAINNFIAAGVGGFGADNMLGAGFVNFANMFATALTDTVDLPVYASVSTGQYYTVVFSDGTSVLVPCIMDGVLTIPVNKNAAGLTYMIY